MASKSLDLDIAEKQVVLTLLKSKNPKRKELILQKFKPEFFENDALRQVFTRCRALYELDGILPKLGDILIDHALDRETRSKLRAWSSSRTLLKHIKRGKASLKQLHKLLKAEAHRRKVTDFVLSLKENYLNADNPDVGLVMHETASLLSELGSSLDEDSDTLRIGGDDKDLKQLDEAITDTFKQQKHNLVKTGLSYFDKRSGGVPRGHISILSATTGGGKSTLALNMALNQFAMGYNVAFVSMEMERDELILRAISRTFKVPFTDLYKGKIEPKKLKKLKAKFLRKVKQKSLENKNFLDIVTPSKAVNMHELLLELRRHKYDVIYVDYINLLDDIDPRRQQWENMSMAARAAKLFAKGKRGDKMRDKPHIVILAQFDAKRAEIRYSKGIVEHASLFWAWIRDEKSKMTHVLEVYQHKTRNQPMYNFTLKEDFEHCRVEGMSYSEFQNYNVTYGAFAGSVPYSSDDSEDKKDKPKTLSERFKNSKKEGK